MRYATVASCRVHIWRAQSSSLAALIRTCVLLARAPLAGIELNSQRDYRMRYRALFALLVPLGDWAVHKASAFDQDLGWCLDRGTRTLRMFEGAVCALRDPFRKCNVRVRVLGAFGDCALV